MFVQISHYQVVNKFMGDIHMINKVKNYICEKISKMVSDNNSKFDFTAYLVNIGFIQTAIVQPSLTFRKENFIVLVSHRDRCGYNNVSITYDYIKLVDIMFIPNSELMSDMIFNNVKREIERLETETV